MNRGTDSRTVSSPDWLVDWFCALKTNYFCSGIERRHCRCRSVLTRTSLSSLWRSSILVLSPISVSISTSTCCCWALANSSWEICQQTPLVGTLLQEIFAPPNWLFWGIAMKKIAFFLFFIKRQCCQIFPNFVKIECGEMLQESSLQCRYYLGSSRTKDVCVVG